MTKTLQPRKPIVYSGTGSAIDNYLKPAVEQEKENWATFTPSKPDPVKRRVLFSLMYQAKWTQPHEIHGEVPDVKRLSDFLQGEKSPVKKKLIQMEPKELEKIITAFKGIVQSKWK